MKIRASLSKKVLLSIGGIIILALAVMLYISNTIVLTSFSRLEEQETRTNLQRAENSINEELADLTKICGDWAPWDDSREFMLGKKPEYDTAGLTADCLANLNLNFMIFVDTAGKLYHKVSIDPEAVEFAPLPEDILNRVLINKSLTAMTEPDDSKAGLIILPNEIIMTAAMPISNSASEKPVYGTLVIGRYLNERMVKKLSERTQLEISVLHNGSQTNYNNVSVDILNKNTITASTNFPNIAGDNYITLKVKLPRKIYNQGLRTIRYFTIAIIATIMIVLAVLVFVLKKLVLRPIDKLTERFTDIGLDYNIDTKLYTDRDDEIGSLAKSFDSLMESLKNKLAELQQSRNAANALNMELVNTAEKLERSNSELKNFAYIASHDLREPMRKISSFGSILQKSLGGKISGDDAENFNFMIEGANRMAEMIDGLLAYSRVGTKTNTTERVNVKNVIKQLSEIELSVLIEEKKAMIDIQSPLADVEADPVQFRQLMQNLIANGIKYQPKGRVPHITISSQPAANGMVRINIADNGIGVAPEFQQAIFAMFKRLHTRNEYDGAGIGLAVCKKIVERHKGQIGVESQPQRGATFWFTLPAAKQPAAVAVAETH